MLRINPSVYDNLQSHIQSWQNDKIVVIHNLLDTDDADMLNHYLMNVSDERWQHSIHPYIDNWYTFDNSPENHHHIINGAITARAAYERGEFSYHFRRFEGYQDDGIKFKEFLLSSQFTNLMMQITGVEVKSLVSVFASMYQSWNYLSVHTDTSRGKIAFVMGLSKNWQESYGGNFELLHDNYSAIKQTVVPNFNTFYFFSVAEGGKPHRVTKVNDVKDKRISFSGWLES